MESSKTNINRERIAKRLKDARNMAGLSQAQAAELMKLQRPAISEIEAGKRKVSVEELIQFANIYSVESTWLLLTEEAEGADKTDQFKLAARELSKLKPEDMKKVLDVIRILPKK